MDVFKLQDHAFQQPNQEVCGFVYPDRYVPLTNKAASSTRFEADPAELARVLAIYGEPSAIFHTHPNGLLEPSDADRNQFFYPNSELWIGKIQNGKLVIRTFEMRPVFCQHR